MIKLPWSKKRHPYTPYSAPITNGILRNSKWASDDLRSKNDRRHVTFSLRRTSSQMSLGAIRAAMEGVEIGNPVDCKNPCPSRGKSYKSKSNSGKSRNDQQRGQRKKADSSRPRLKEGFIEKPGSPDKSKRQLSDLSADKLASRCEKCESNRTIDTNDDSDISMDRHQLRKSLTFCDEKMETKGRRKSQEDEVSSNSPEDSLPVVHKPFREMNEASSRNQKDLKAKKSTLGDRKKKSKASITINDASPDGSGKRPRRRRRLSLLLDQKIKAKTRRESQELIGESSSNDEFEQ